MSEVEIGQKVQKNLSRQSSLITVLMMSTDDQNLRPQNLKRGKHPIRKLSVRIVKGNAKRIVEQSYEDFESKLFGERSSVKTLSARLMAR